MEDIVVSIWCITYNHEQYIRDAIESFLAQKTDFRYEIIIHDDASTDGTAEIIKKYEQKFPDFIHGIYQTENQWSLNSPSVKWMNDIAIQNCSGKYIAICEGDDYWLDVQKLQLQVDYLESHPECIMTVHDAVRVDCRNYKIKSGSMYEKDCAVSAGDIIIQNKNIFTPSMVYRREVLYMNELFLNSGIGDYTSLLYCLTKGEIYYFSRIMSVYRQFHEGSWTCSVLQKEVGWIHNIRMIDFLKSYNEYTGRTYEMYVISRIQKSAQNIVDSFRNVTFEEFSDTLKLCMTKAKPEHRNLLQQLERLWRQIFDDSYMDERVCRFVKQYQKVVIMGAGVYAGILAGQMNYYGIDFEGFVVSDDQQAVKNYLNKPVWKWNSLPFDLSNTGIVIGINPIIWEQIERSLDSAGEVNYICPFLLGL